MFKYEQENNFLRNENHNYKIQIENFIKEKQEFIKLNDEEKIKNKNLVNLIKELEKKKSSSKVEAELKEQIDYYSLKLKEVENKYKNKLEQKDLIIKKLDDIIMDYEQKLIKLSN